MALTEQDVLNALKDCYDPEVPVNIVDLGLIYAVRLIPEETANRNLPKHRVELEMTLTSRACPAHARIVEQICNRLAGIPEIAETTVKIVWEPPWSPERISEEARRQLQIG